jgi:hypothetical protein
VADADEAPPASKIAPAITLRKRISPFPCYRPVGRLRLCENPSSTSAKPKEFVNQKICAGPK